MADGIADEGPDNRDNDATNDDDDDAEGGGGEEEEKDAVDGAPTI